MNELDEVTGPISEEGRDVNVIQKQIPAKTGAGTIVFIVILCFAKYNTDHSLYL